MNDERDPLDQVMQALKARSRGRAMSDVDLEDRIMQEFGKVQARRRRRLTTALVASLVLIVSGAAFAAAGGVEIVEGWFGKVELVDPSGEKPSVTYELQGTQLLDSDGNVVGELSISGGDGSDDEGKPGTIELKR